MKFIIILLIMLHILSYNVHSNRTLKFNELWKKWKSLYAKQYNDPNEELIRQRIWNKNLIKIQLHNLRYDLGFETYSIGLSRFTDIEWNEFCSMYKFDKRLIIPESSFIEEDYDVNNIGWTPDSYDWRHLNVVNEPRDEGSCIGSYAFAVTAVTESQYALRTSNRKNFSVQQFIDCTRIYGNMGCHGGYTFTLFIYLQNFGLETEENYPFTGEDQDCLANSSDVIVQSIGYKFHRHGYETILKWAVYNEGPYVISMNIDEKFLHYKSGIYQSDTCTHYNLNQSMLLVGYGYDNDGNDYWILQNNWGTNWGEQGYVKVLRNNWNMCGIASMAFRPILRGF
ncbi:unnamed protein product [Schistosoma intercalatum]|nr:unnamed protein product [Schistosoma intercalatum]CAH8486414.1 unnamed protein product [Schistosoma intercalatum]